MFSATFPPVTEWDVWGEKKESFPLVAKWDIWGEQSFPLVPEGDISGDEGAEYIRSRNIFSKSTSEKLLENDWDWDSVALCSPVLETWARWEPEIKSSKSRSLSIFSNETTAITQLTDYMQGRVIKVRDPDLYELLCLADMLQVDDVYKYCRYRIAHLPLNKDNYHKILHAISMHGFEHEQMDQFIRGNLTVLCKEKGILTISPDAVEFLLTDEELSYWPMDDRFVFITKWCNANDGRILYFERWFDHLDLNKIDKDIVEAIVKNEDLVRTSVSCLHKVNAHLCDRQEKPVPFVFTLNNIRIGSNVIGINLEDKLLYKFNFPDQIINSNPTTARGSDKSVSFDHSDRCVYEYDMNENICTKKMVLCKGQYPDNISHMLDANDRLIFIGSTRRKGRTRYGLKHDSVLYQQVNNDEIKLEIEPLVTLTFKVSCACAMRSAIIMTTTTYSKRSKLFSYNLVTNQLSEMDLEIDRQHRIQPLVQCVLPVHDRILLIEQENIRLLSLNEEKGTYRTEARHANNASVSDTNPRYIFFSDYITELNSKNIRLCYSSKSRTDLTKWSTYELKRLNFKHGMSVLYAFLDRKRPFCHIMCPHCDPSAWQKEEELLRAQESLERRYDFEYYDYSDRYYDDDDDYYDYDSDPWNQTELIWDGSADEFVEAWW